MTPPTDSIELLQAMVRVDSVNSAISGRPKAESELVGLLSKSAKSYGLKVTRLPVEGRADQLLVTHEVAPDAPWLLFDSHMDTVAVDGMTVEPFGAEIRQGRLYGRGACDTKGTGAAMLWALKGYAESSDAGNNIAIFFGVDEEAGMHGVNAFLKHDFPKLGFTPKGVIVGEPTELHPVIAHNGVIRWRIQTHGKAAHSSVPHEGRSAISMMIKLIQAIENDYIPVLTAEHDLTGRAACSINLIRGGSAANIIPDHCQIDVDRRVVPGEDPSRLLPDFVAILDKARASDPTIDYTLEVGTNNPPLLPSGDESLLDAIKQVLKGHGLPTMVLGAPFGTHACHYSNAGLPAVVFGPGEIDQAHTKDEYISLDQLALGVTVYGDLMRQPI